MRPDISANLKGTTWPLWRKQNRTIVTDMATAGLDSEAIVAAWEALSHKRGYVVTRMKWVQESIDGPPSRGDGLNENGFLPSPSDDIPLLCDLKAAGLA